MEGDKANYTAAREAGLFQSTPSAWRETKIKVYISIDTRFQSTPSAWRETRLARILTSIHAISIHSLRMEGDEHLALVGRAFMISIHSLRMEGDSRKPLQKSMNRHFNPLPPHGGRHP